MAAERNGDAKQGRDGYFRAGALNLFLAWYTRDDGWLVKERRTWQIPNLQKGCYKRLQKANTCNYSTPISQCYKIFSKGHHHTHYNYKYDASGQECTHTTGMLNTCFQHWAKRMTFVTIFQEILGIKFCGFVVCLYNHHITITPIHDIVYVILLQCMYTRQSCTQLHVPK